MYTKFLENVSHILTNLCISFVYKIKRTVAAKICIQNVYIQKSIEMWDTFCVHLVYNLYVHQFWSTDSEHHENYYTMCIQNPYKMYTNNGM